MLLINEVFGKRLDRRIERQHLFDQAGNLCQLRHQDALLIFFESIAAGQRNRQERECSQLRRERLGRRYADLRAGVCQQRQRGLANH